MTLRQLQKRIDFWLEQLKPLGLSHWTIHLSIVDEVQSPNQVDANASCSCSTHYDKMWLEFDSDFLAKAEQEDIDVVIIHELLHAAMRDLDHDLEDVCEYLGEPHKSSWSSGVDHSREGLVERLAQTLYYAFRDNVVQ